MADKQAQAMERLVAKLSAVRKTLRGEERRLLDAMVLAAQAEVTTHSKSMRPIARPAAEVELHAASVRRITETKTTRPSALKSMGPDDSKSAEPEGRQFLRIQLNDGNYRVTVL